MHRQKKNPKVLKTKTNNSKRTVEKKESHNGTDRKNKSVIVSKKLSVQKKGFSPSWEKSRGRSLVRHLPLKKSSPRCSSETTKNKSSSPQYEKTLGKNKSKIFSPKGKESSPKRGVKKVKDTSHSVKDKTKQSPLKAQNSPARNHKMSSPRMRRHDTSTDKRRSHYDDQKSSPRREKSRKTVRRDKSNENDCSGGLKKGGKILPLKPPAYMKDNYLKKESGHSKSSEKNSNEIKGKQENVEKDRKRSDREKIKEEKDKGKCEKDKLKPKKNNSDHEKRSLREKDLERDTVRNKSKRSRELESVRVRVTKERELERHKEKDESLERCRERQREREKTDKDRKEKDKKHREATDGKLKDINKESSLLLDRKSEGLSRNSGDSSTIKSSEKLVLRDRRNNEKSGNQNKDGKEVHVTEKDHDRRDARRSDENERKQLERDYDSRKSRDDMRSALEPPRRSIGDGKRTIDSGNDSRRQWEEGRHTGDSLGDRRRVLDSNNDRRLHSLGRRPAEDLYRRGRREGESDLREFSIDEKRRYFSQQSVTSNVTVIIQLYKNK